MLYRVGRIILNDAHIVKVVAESKDGRATKTTVTSVGGVKSEFKKHAKAAFDTLKRGATQAATSR